MDQTLFLMKKQLLPASPTFFLRCGKLTLKLLSYYGTELWNLQRYLKKLITEVSYSLAVLLRLLFAGQVMKLCQRWKWKLSYDIKSAVCKFFILWKTSVICEFHRSLRRVYSTFKLNGSYAESLSSFMEI